MTKIVRAQSVSNARGILAALAGDGYDIFRGQTHPWPPVPTLLRLKNEDRFSAIERLQGFFEWCAQHPRLSPYANDVSRLTAIAQHYGISTTFLDVTTSVEVAVFFALEGQYPENSADAVVFAWKRDELNQSSNLRVVDVPVDNLWRLECQKGCFLEAESPGSLLSDALNCFEVRFPREGARSSIHQANIYPPRKSMLETVLDVYFYREMVASLRTQIKVPYTFVKRWHSYESAFRGRRIPVRSEKLSNIENGWLAHRSHLFSNVNRPNRTVVTVDFGNETREWMANVVAAVWAFVDGTPHIHFDVKLFDDTATDLTISKAIDNVFDGIAILPYTPDQRVGCIITCLSLLPCLIRPNDEEPLYDQLIGKERLLLHFAPFNGGPVGAEVSRPALEAAIDPSAIGDLRPFFRRAIADDKCKLLCFSLDHMHSMKFEKLVELFAKQIIPTQLMQHLEECLAQGGDKNTVLWDIVVDPLLLAYVSISSYEYDYPFIWEADLDRVLFLFEGMTSDDIADEIVTFAPDVLRTGILVVLRLHCFDDGLIREIPEAMQLIESFIEQGGLGILEVTTSLKPASEAGLMDRTFPPLGAFETWIIANGLSESSKSWTREEKKERFLSFIEDLPVSNWKIKRLLSQHGIDFSRDAG